MIPKRSEQGNALPLNGSADDAPIMSQVLKSSESHALAKAEKKDEEKMSLFWRVFGGTILSIAALVVITLFNNLMNHLAEMRSELARANEARSTAVNELRTEIARINEARAELIRKDEFNTRMSSNWDRIQALQQQNNTQNATITSLKTEIDGFKERLAKQAADHESARKEGNASLEVLKKEWAASAESIRKEVAALEAVKERLALLASDLKVNRDELLKLRQDVDKNQSYDLERKAIRDGQHKQIEEAIKELQKGIQDCREKLARLEALNGSSTTPAPKKGSGGQPPAGPSRPEDEQ